MIYLSKNNIEQLTDEFISEQLIMGYTLPELALQWEIEYATLCNTYKAENDKFNRLLYNGKQEPYYYDEFDYGKKPSYNYEEVRKEIL
tara:strand:- start:1265 stop:1528 length:264 start_codon:yes stop_codon:yes gene_type:complete